MSSYDDQGRPTKTVWQSHWYRPFPAQQRFFDSEDMFKPHPAQVRFYDEVAPALNTVQTALLKKAINEQQAHVAELKALTLKPVVAPVYSPTGRYQKDETTFGPGDIVEYASPSKRPRARYVVCDKDCADYSNIGKYLTPEFKAARILITSGRYMFWAMPTSLRPVGWLRRASQ